MSSSENWTLIVSGGGSGGHLFPALAVIEELRKTAHPPSRIFFLTADREIDQLVLNTADLETFSLPIVDSLTFRRHPIRSMASLFKSAWKARGLIKSVSNPVVLATGGFGSLPGGMAAWSGSVPLLLLEQNAVAGRATSLLARGAITIFSSFEGTDLDRRWPQKSRFVGNPVRPEIAALHHDGELNDRRVLLVLGGSQGAKKVNQAICSFAKSHPSALTGWRLYHHTGITDAPLMEQIYREYGVAATVSPFFDNMPELYRQAGLVVSRAGGTSLAELACAGVPSILVPYPNSLRDHQQKNADRFVAAGGAICIPQTQVDFETQLTRELQRLLTDDSSRERMREGMRSLARPNAAQEVAQAICALRR